MNHALKLDILTIAAFFHADKWVATRLFKWELDTEGYGVHFHTHTGWVVRVDDYEVARLLFEPRDMWVGLYRDTQKKRLYFMLLPTLGFVVQLPGA